MKQKDFFQHKNVLVTGGAGAIGSRLVQALKEIKGIKIFIIDDLSANNNIIIKGPNIEFYKASILNKKILNKIFKQKVDIVFHLAANFANQNSIEHPKKDLLVNGLGTFLLLELAQKNKVKKFVFTSSSCVYGSQKRALEEDKASMHLDTPYAINKLLAEMYCLYFHQYYDLNTIILRIFNSFGPGEKPGKYRNVVPNFIKLALDKKPLLITGNGKETRDFNFIDDVIDKILFVTVHKKSIGQIYNIGKGKRTSIIKLAQIINKLTNNKAGIKFLPRRKWDNILHRQANISKFINLGYSKKPIPLEQALKETIKFIKSL